MSLHPYNPTHPLSSSIIHPPKGHLKINPWTYFQGFTVCSAMKALPKILFQISRRKVHNDLEIIDFEAFFFAIAKAFSLEGK